MKYEKLCNDILLVIDKNNISDVFHCVTRIRFVIKDKTAVDKSALEKIDGVIQVKEVGNQIQLVIGTHVKDVYEEFCNTAELKKNDEINDEIDVVAIEKVSTFNKIFEVLSAIFLPIMPAFVAGGMLKSLAMLLVSFGLMDSGNGVVLILNSLGDAPFYFLPFMVGYTTAKSFKLNEVIGLMVAGCLMYPTFGAQTYGESLQFLFLNIPAYSYASSVLPTILCVIIFSYAYRAVDKYMPKNISLVFTGMITFVVVMPLLLAFIAPLGNFCGNLLGSVTLSLFTNAGPLAGALFTGFMSFIIITGMHSSLLPVSLQIFMTYGYCFLFPALLFNNFAVAGATLGASLKIKDTKLKAAAISSGSLGILGITEPALYTINLKYKHSLIATVVGGAVSGALYMLLHVKCYAYAMPNIFSLPAYMDGTNNLIYCIICLVVSFMLSFAYSFFFVKD